VASEADDAARMTLSEHLDEFRSRLIRCLLGVLVGFVLAWIWMTEIMAFLRRPLDDVIAKLPPERVELIQNQPGEAFFTSMKVAFFAGFILASPVILHQIWAFVAAGLYGHERRAVKYYAFPGFGLFFGGAALAYFLVMPWALDFLIGFASETTELRSLLTVSSFVTLVAWAMFIFGLVFQLPIIMVFLMRLGVVEPDTFRRWRRAAIVGSFTIAMVLTPPDVISQVALATCMTLLYEGAIFIGARVAQSRKTS